MIRNSILTILACLLCLVQGRAADFRVTDWGVRADGVTLNTRAIQRAIDAVSEQGGGRLVFTPGRYLSGSVYLKSNVELHLERGAVLAGSSNVFDYDVHNTWPSLVFALNQRHIAITGQGCIQGAGARVGYDALYSVQKGILKDPVRYDRTDGWRPQNIYCLECEDITILDLTLRDPGSWNQTYERCKNVRVEREYVDSKAYWNNDGIDIVDCDGVVIRDCFFDAADDVICFKSHKPDYICQNILVENCVGRSSANGVKFGTISRGGFRNVKFKNITIYDTYRSAFTLAAVDGAVVEDIEIDGLRSINTGNVFFLTVGDRWSSGKRPLMRNITMKNVYAEVPAGKPDPGYAFEGPIEDLPRNISPSVITGMPENLIENLRFENVEIVYPGGGNPFYAKREVDDVPEMPKAYPEFSMYKELPAWGFYIRHAKGVTFDNVKITALKKDYRAPFVLDNVHGTSFTGVTATEPAPEGKATVTAVRSSGVSGTVTAGATK